MSTAVEIGHGHRPVCSVAGRGRQFFIDMRRARSDIRRIATTYTDGTPGEPVAMFNAMGLLEIAICMGGSVRATVAPWTCCAEIRRPGAHRIRGCTSRPNTEL